MSTSVLGYQFAVITTTQAMLGYKFYLTIPKLQYQFAVALGTNSVLGYQFSVMPKRKILQSLANDDIISLTNVETINLI